MAKVECLWLPLLKGRPHCLATTPVGVAKPRVVLFCAVLPSIIVIAAILDSRELTLPDSSINMMQNSVSRLRQFVPEK